MASRVTFRVLSTAALLAAVPAWLPAEVFAIRAGQLVDPESATVAADQVILVEGQTITAVGADLAIPPGATVIDLSDRAVLPGMFDAHAHLCITMQRGRHSANFFLTTLMDSNAYRAIHGVANARSMLEAGFTTVRDVGNAGNYVDTDLRHAIEEGLVAGPTMINAGRIIAPFGGQLQLQPDKPDLAEPEYLFADTRDELKKAIRENIHYGAKLIKIVIDDQPYIYSTEDIRFVVEEAALAGLRVAAHAFTEKGALNAAQAGVASIEHGVRISDEALAIAKRNGVMLVPTPFTQIVGREFGRDLDEYRKRNDEWFVDPLRRAYAAGVTLVHGPDLIMSTREWPRGKLSIETISSWVEAGIPAPVILQALTANAARLLGVEGERGAIRPGMKADIIATKEDPLEHIETLKAVTFVMKEGSVFVSEAHPRRKPGS
jgi:imidazolonepropionase-like amidohydrolase